MYSAELMRELGTVVKVDVEVIMHKWEHTGDDDWQITTEENLAALFLLFLLFSSRCCWLSCCFWGGCR